MLFTPERRSRRTFDTAVSFPLKIADRSMRSRVARWLTTSLAIAMLTFCVTTASAQKRPSAGMIRFPDVSADKIVFVYADDLWLVDKQGGVATPLASPAGQERFARFSRDGQTIAFVGNYDGDEDIYTLPVNGGVPHRVTFQGASEQLCEWTPDDRVLYSTNGYSGLGRQPHLYTVSTKDPAPQKVGVPYGSNGAISDDGVWLAYTPHSRDFRTWKRYRGGMASDIWLFNLKNQTSKQITDWEGTDTMPMWHGQTVYYLSDQGDAHRLNIWAYNTATGARTQITKFTEYDCKFPAIGPEEIVFQNGASIYLLNLTSGESKAIEIMIPGAQPDLRPQRIDAAKFINGGDISPSAARVALEARGDIWTAPVKNGSPRNLTRTSGAAERYPSWSPDGQWIAYMSDMSGEYELYVTQSDGLGETKRLTNDGQCYRYSPNWSPDSKHILFADKTGALFMYSFESDSVKELDRDPYGSPIEANWSHNSQWITYTKSSDTRTPTSSVWVCEVATGEKHQLTSGFYADESPVFDRKGEYLYFISGRAISNPEYEDLGTTWIYQGTQVLVAMPLRAEVKHFMMPESDEETWKKEGEKEDAKGEDSEKESAGEKQAPADSSPSDKDSDKAEQDKKDGAEDAADEAKGDDKADDDKDDKEKADKEKADAEKSDTFAIEVEGIERRAYQLPAANGTLNGLAVNDKGHLLYARMPNGSGAPSIKILDLTQDDPKEATVADGAAAFGTNAKGDKLIVLRGSSLFVIAAAAGQKLSEPVSTAGMTAVINPREEWKQIFVDAWRMERDFFYDPNMHGVDWLAVRKHYEPMLEDCTTRRDLSYVIGEMIAELNVGHAYYREGDVEQADTVPVGSLACDFDLKDGAYVITKLYEGAVWDVDARNPLRTVGVKEGEFLVAVNHIPVDTSKDIYASFQGMAGRTVTLTVSDQAKGGEERHVVVDMLRSDSNHRYRDWIESNRAYIDEKSKGRIGYIYVPNTSINGQDDLVRQFFGQLNKDALIIDDRWNGGGQIPTRFIELLNRPITNYWARRDGHDWIWPPDSHQGPKCMLINGLAGSGGDMFPALFRQAGLGKLIGMRTWGGLVGITGGPSLIDGAGVTAPSFAYYEKDGTWGIEGHGVDPDIEVIDDPAIMVTGADPQMDAAIAHLLEQLELHPYQAPERPAYPDRSKFGIKEEDK